MEQQPLNNPERVPRLNQCSLCKEWQLEKNLLAIEIPDQGGNWIQKLCCQECLDKTMRKEAVRNESLRETGFPGGLRGVRMAEPEKP